MIDDLLDICISRRQTILANLLHCYHQFRSTLESVTLQAKYGSTHTAQSGGIQLPWEDE